ncbi:rod shape-determining protein MreD [Actibacterium sp. D379-3]
MIDPQTSQRWIYQLLFAALATALLFLQLLPLHTLPARFPGPDLLLCLTLAWVQRRPDFIPPLLLAAVFLVADLLLMRPPGLWTALVVLAAEFLRSRQTGAGEVPFAAEWLLTTVVIVAISLGYALILGVTATAFPGLAMSVIKIVMTVLAYPAVVLVAHQAFGLRRLTAAEIDAQRTAR